VDRYTLVQYTSTPLVAAVSGVQILLAVLAQVVAARMIGPDRVNDHAPPDTLTRDGRSVKRFNDREGARTG
jgi:hypothetical protein